MGVGPGAGCGMRTGGGGGAITGASVPWAVAGTNAAADVVCNGAMEGGFACGSGSDLRTMAADAWQFTQARSQR